VRAFFWQRAQGADAVQGFVSAVSGQWPLPLSVQPAKNRMVIHTGAGDICTELVAYSPGDKDPINRHHLPVFGEQRGFVYEPLGLERMQIERKTEADNPIDRRKVNVVVVNHYNQLPCVTFSVNGLRPLAALELSRIAANGWVRDWPTEDSVTLMVLAKPMIASHVQPIIITKRRIASGLIGLLCLLVPRTLARL